MAIDKSELSSLGSLLLQVRDRISSMATSAHENKDDNDANELYAIERSLNTANHKLERLLTDI